MGRLVPPLAAALFGLSLLLSIHFLPWASWHSEALAFIAALLLSWRGLATGLRLQVRPTIDLPFAALPFIGLGLVALLQGVYGLLPYWGDVWAFWFYMLLCIACTALGFAAASSLQNEVESGEKSNVFDLLAFTVVICGLVSFAIALAQLFSLSELSGWIVRPDKLRRPGANLAQPNHLATLLVMGVASAVFLHRRKKVGKIAAVSTLLVLAAGIAISESRAGALSTLVLLLWWLVKRRAIGDPTPSWAAFGAGAVFVAIFCAWPQLLNALHLLDHHAEDRVLEGSLRFQIWPQLIDALSSRPWTGWGVQQVAAALSAVADRYPISEPYTYSHNLWLDLALWVGLPFAVVLAVANAVWIWRRISALDKLLPWYGLAIGAPLAVHSMLEYPHAYAYFLAPVMFMMGAVEASTGGRPFAQISIKSATVALFLATAALSWSVVEYLAIEEDFRIARFQALRVGSPPPEHQRARIILFDQLGGALNAARITPTPNMSHESVRILQKAALHDPWTASQYRYAVALALNGNPAEAVRQFQVVRSMRGQKVYEGIKKEFAELAAAKYPQLRDLNLP